MICRLILRHAMTPGLLNIRNSALQGRNSTTLATNLLNDLHTRKGYVALIDMAKTCSLVPRPMLTDIISTACTLEPIVRMINEIYCSTPAVPSPIGRELLVHPSSGMKEGCPLSPTLFLLHYDVLLRDHCAPPRGQPQRLCWRHSCPCQQLGNPHCNPRPRANHLTEKLYLSSLSSTPLSLSY